MATIQSVPDLELAFRKIRIATATFRVMYTLSTENQTIPNINIDTDFNIDLNGISTLSKKGRDKIRKRKQNDPEWILVWFNMNKLIDINQQMSEWYRQIGTFVQHASKEVIAEIWAVMCRLALAIGKGRFITITETVKFSYIYFLFIINFWKFLINLL